jgi:hypothetical protein
LYLVSTVQIKLEFDCDKAYGNCELSDPITLDNYMELPVVEWCHKKIGAMNWPRDPNEVLYGDGWQIGADWSDYLEHRSNLPYVYVIITKPVEQKLITEFWMRFGK